jgi:hypothetical protein
MPNKEFSPSRLKIVEFKIINGDITAPYEFDSDLIDNYETNMAFSSSSNVEEQVIRANMGFEIKTKSSKNTKEATASFDFVYIFEVEGLKDFFSDKANSESLKKIMISIAAISFSTSRGVLLTRLQGTVMKEYILPVIDPSKLLNEWLNQMKKDMEKKTLKAKKK